MKAEEQLVSLCQEIGKKIPSWTQGQGGNVSVKSAAENKIFIKASGARLDQVSLEKGVAAANLFPLQEALKIILLENHTGEEKYATLLAENSLHSTRWGRLSMETGFHALLDTQFVMHFHSLAAVLMAHESQSRGEKWKNWSENQSQITFTTLPIITPGISLSKSIYEAEKCEAYIMQNHGVVLSTNQANDLLARWQKFKLAFCHEFQYPEIFALLDKPSPSIKTLLQKYNVGKFSYLLPDIAVFHERILKILTAHNDSFHLTHDAFVKDPEATELWLAIQILLKAEPTLSELPLSMQKYLPKLPTEIFRKGSAS